MKDVPRGSATLLPEASEIRREAAEQAAPAARAAADRITQWLRRHPTGPQARAASRLLRQAEDADADADASEGASEPGDA